MAPLEVYPYARCHKCKETLSGITIARLFRNGTAYPVVKCASCGASRSITSGDPLLARALHPEDDKLFPHSSDRPSDADGE